MSHIDVKTKTFQSINLLPPGSKETSQRTDDAFTERISLSQSLKFDPNLLKFRSPLGIKSQTIWSVKSTNNLVTINNRNVRAIKRGHFQWRSSVRNCDRNSHLISPSIGIFSSDKFLFIKIRQNRSTQSKTPNDHTSAFFVYRCPRSTSGAVHLWRFNGVKTKHTWQFRMKSSWHLLEILTTQSRQLLQSNQMSKEY